MSRIILLLLVVLAVVSASSEPARDNPCPPNERLDGCGPASERKCGIVQDPFYWPVHCGPPDCRCNIGYKRHKNGECVLPEEC